MNFRLRDWFPKGDVGLGLRIPEGVSSESIASLKAEHVDAYRTGHAFSYASHEWDCFTDTFTPRHAAYAEGVMAWVAGKHSSQVKTLDLKSGQKGSFLLEDRARIGNIAISSSMVVALSTEGCHGWSLTTGESHCLRYSSSSRRQMLLSVSGETLAFADPIGPIGGENGFAVSTWTFQDQKSSRFSVATPTETCEHSIMLDSNGETLLFFYSSFPLPGALMDFYFRRTNLDGDVLAQGVIVTPSIESFSRKDFQPAVPKEYDGRAVIWSFTESPRGVRNFSELILICYNFQENRLELRVQMVDGLGRNTNTKSHLFYWKDTAYYLDYGDERFNIRVVDLQELTCREAKVDIPYSTLDLRYVGGYNPLLFGDETFFITTFGQGFGVWCFDKNVQLFNEDISYKEDRKRNIKKRLDSKRDG